jgi:hypothetical protein
MLGAPERGGLGRAEVVRLGADRLPHLRDVDGWGDKRHDGAGRLDVAHATGGHVDLNQIAGGSARRLDVRGRANIHTGDISVSPAHQAHRLWSCT